MNKSKQVEKLMSDVDDGMSYSDFKMYLKLNKINPLKDLTIEQIKILRSRYIKYLVLDWAWIIILYGSLTYLILLLFGVV